MNKKISYLVVCLLFFQFSILDQQQFLVATQNSHEELSIFTRKIITDNFPGALGIQFIDFDKDGDIDILGASHLGHELAWLENTNLEFKKRVITSEFEGATDITAFDLNNDSNNEIIGIADINSEIAIWEQNNANFTKKILKEAYYGAFSVGGIDIDNDKDIDLVSTAQTSNEINLWINQGNLHFTEFVISDDFGDPSFSFFADINNDKLEDIIVTSIQNNKISYWRNNNNYSFTESNIAMDYFKAHSGEPVDVDNDKDFDIVAVSYSGLLNWYENTYSGGFIDHLISNNLSGPVDARAGDIDIDNDTDIVVIDQSEEEIILFRNDGNQNFTWNLVSSNYRGSRCLLVDIDEDGDIDILTSSNQLGDISLWINNQKRIEKNTEFISTEEHTSSVPSSFSVTAVFLLLIIKRKFIKKDTL